MSSTSQDEKHKMLLMAIIAQSNPSFEISGWPSVAKTLEPLGMKQDTCRKMFYALRKEYLAKFGNESPQAAGEPSTPAPKPKKAKNKAKRAHSADNDNDEDAEKEDQPQPKKRSGARKTAAAAVKKSKGKSVEAEGREQDDVFAA